MTSANDLHRHDHDDEFERGLVYDIGTVMSRRRMLFAVGGASLGALALAACRSSDGDTASTAGSTAGTESTAPTASTVAPSTAATTTAADAAATTAADAAACVDEIPDETGGPYPGDGSNGPNVLSDDGVVRSDITSSFGSSTTVADGIPLEVTLTIQDTATCTPMPGAAVYVWHCDAPGRYSLYSDGVTNENYLRGVQEADANGQVTFTTIVPGCYSGRWPHIHFEVFDALSSVQQGSNSIKTSQLALPQDMCEVVYQDSRYPQSTQNLSQLSLESDNVFSDDGGVHQLATISGSNDAGYTATLTVGI
jgi:protocatechuate 3,4-dioxygenase beta subunit